MQLRLQFDIDSFRKKTRNEQLHYLEHNKDLINQMMKQASFEAVKKQIAEKKFTYHEPADPIFLETKAEASNRLDRLRREAKTPAAPFTPSKESHDDLTADELKSLIEQYKKEDKLAEETAIREHKWHYPHANEKIPFDDTIEWVTSDSVRNEINQPIFDLIAEYLDKFSGIHHHDALPASHWTPFNSAKLPEISIRKYFERICTYSKIWGNTALLGLAYFDRILALQEKNPTFIIQDLNIHRLLLVCLMVASKVHQDFYFNNRYWANLGGISTFEINALERELLSLLDFDIMEKDGSEIRNILNILQGKPATSKSFFQLTEAMPIPKAPSSRVVEATRRPVDFFHQDTTIYDSAAGTYLGLKADAQGKFLVSRGFDERKAESYVRQLKKTYGKDGAVSLSLNLDDKLYYIYLNPFICYEANKIDQSPEIDFLKQEVTQVAEDQEKITWHLSGDKRTLFVIAPTDALFETEISRLVCNKQFFNEQYQFNGQYIECNGFGIVKIGVEHIQKAMAESKAASQTQQLRKTSQAPTTAPSLPVITKSATEQKYQPAVVVAQPPVEVKTQPVAKRELTIAEKVALAAKANAKRVLQNSTHKLFRYSQDYMGHSKAKSKATQKLKQTEPEAEDNLTRPKQTWG